jgi:hypothetical protein
MVSVLIYNDRGQMIQAFEPLFTNKGKHELEIGQGIIQQPGLYFYRMVVHGTAIDTSVSGSVLFLK